jgi:hypothetical protein
MTDTLADATGGYAVGGPPPPMTSARFHDLWQRSGLTLGALADALGMRGRHAPTHLREMADGARPVPGPTGIALEAVVLGLVDDQELTDLLSEAISDSLGPDWSSTDGARYCVRALRTLLGRPNT